MQCWVKKMIRDMDDKFRKRIEKILNSHLMVKDNDEMIDELMDVVEDARYEGWEDGHDPKSFWNDR